MVITISLGGGGGGGGGFDLMFVHADENHGM